MRLLTLVFFLMFVRDTLGVGFEVNLKPNCKDCKWFVHNKGQLYQPGQCSLFSKNIEYGNAEVIIHRYAIQCRLNSYLCGMDGSHFTPSLSQSNTDISKKSEKREAIYIKELQKIQDDIQELENNFNGEVCEKDEIRNLEKEIALLRNKLEQYKKLK